MTSIAKIARSSTLLATLVLGTVGAGRVAAPVVTRACDELLSSRTEPAALVSSSVVLVAAALLAAVTAWIVTATAWCLVTALCSHPAAARTVHPLLNPWLVRLLVGAALGTTTLSPPAHAGTSTPAAPRAAATGLPQALAGLPLPDRPTGAAPRRGPRSATAPTTSPSVRTHTVVAGDSLWAIVAARSGPGTSPAQVDRGWRALYAANRLRIGADPDLIHPGTMLRLPRPNA